MKAAPCHPDRKHKARGLCKMCYARTFRKRTPGPESYSPPRTLEIVAAYEDMVPNPVMVERFGIQWDSIMRTVNRHYRREGIAA